ncbi:hypothetical protein E1301_Tti015144 [Triplophysa tibetana]|uniref:C-type lectin domain-containing protein n=1 Tax=Triplophysa tibetana TaxID=1572043 RepID=A0A5A9PNS3_9TELE|nr:hypothetical protein E1301_Tti015144 [Triplophysa tibetana]
MSEPDRCCIHYQRCRGEQRLQNGKKFPGPYHKEGQGTSGQEQNHKQVPVELRRQGTEPSRRFLMDLNTGMLKENVGEMNRRVSGFYNPSAHEVRQGTQNSRASLVDVRTGQMLYPLSEMQRNAAAHEGSIRLHKRETEPSRILMDLNAGQLKEHRNKMDSKATGSKWEVVSGPDQSPDTSAHEKNHNSDSVEFYRQGTEPSRRFLMDLNTGMLKENVGEMNRRVAGYYNPSAYEVRQGTQNSRASIVDLRTGQLLYTLSEMQRRADPYTVKSGPAHEEKNSQHISGHDNHKPDHVELRRQGTEPSRRFLMDLNTGMLKENVGEMNRRVAGFYNPSAHEVRQGTQNSRASIVDLRTGQLLYTLSEMQRRADPLKESILKGAGDRHEMLRQEEAGAVCHGEIIQGRCYSFNPTPQTFNEAEGSCKSLSPEGHVASVANADVHKQLVAMVTKGKNHPVLTWLGGIQKENRFHWKDGSSWGYSDWMPGHPQKHKLSCLEMFRFDESWWTAVDCGQRRAFICSHPMTA